MTTAIGRWAATSNMSLALATLQAAIDAPQPLPRLSTFTGPSGFGKTVAAAAAAARTNAAYLRCESIWTQKTILEKLAIELGIVHVEKTATRIMDQIKNRLDDDPVPLVLDETDNIVAKKSVEIIRDIADATDIAILMIGEEAMPARLKEWERFDNRIISAGLAQPCSLEDGLLLRDVYRGRVDIADDLVEHFVRECRGVTRRVCVNLHDAQRVAVEELETLRIDRVGWGARPVRNGEVPRRPRGIAA